MKARYLTYISYIGTHFRSAEKLWPVKGVIVTNDPASVQGLMENALSSLRPVNFPRVYLSSRTDGGVHAINATAHVDLERPGGNIYCPKDIIKTLNKYFVKQTSTISINKCFRVPDDFDARRKALSRTYLYRLAVYKKGIEIRETGSVSNIPIEEWKRCYYLRFPKFDIDKLREAATYLPGYHDFSTFKKFDPKKKNKHNRRLLYSVKIADGKPNTISYREGQVQYYDYYDIYFHGQSFVHNQIRRMLSALIGTATGFIEPKDIKVMLQVPSKLSWPSQLHNCPPDGLYLCDIEYDPKDLIYETDSESICESEC